MRQKHPNLSGSTLQQFFNQRLAQAVGVDRAKEILVLLHKNKREAQASTTGTSSRANSTASKSSHGNEGAVAKSQEEQGDEHGLMAMESGTDILNDIGLSVGSSSSSSSYSASSVSTSASASMDPSTLVDNMIHQNELLDEEKNAKVLLRKDLLACVSSSSSSSSSSSGAIASAGMIDNSFDFEGMHSYAAHLTLDNSFLLNNKTLRYSTTQFNTSRRNSKAC